MAADAAPDGITTDAILGGRVTLRQLRRGHRVGSDTVLLAGFAAGLPGTRVLDLGAGVGGLGLSIATLRPDRSAVLVEREPLLAALATENAALNGVAARVRIVCADVLDLPPDLAAERCFQLVVCNPPFGATAGRRASPDPLRSAAHSMPCALLDGWIAAAAKALGPRGRLALIYPAEQLAAVLSALRPSFGSIAILPVHARAEMPASRILVAAERCGKAPLRLLAGCAMHEATGRFTDWADKAHRGDFPALAPAERKGRP